LWIVPLVLLLVSLAGSSRLAAAHHATAPACSITWVDQEPQIEAYLKTASIDRIDEVPVGVTKPKHAYFEGGGPVASAAWKPLPTRFQNGFLESYKAELAAYALDKLLGLNRVPPAVERNVNGQAGAIVLWVDGVKSWDVNNPVHGPDPLAWDHEIARMKMFDQLIANIDRNQGNLLYDADYHVILIDHSRAFTRTKDLKRMAQLGRVDRALWDRMLALDAASLEAAIGQWYGKKEIEAILQRRDEMKAGIEARLKNADPRAVFLPDLPARN
jgi:hypothetical protein